MGVIPGCKANRWSPPQRLGETNKIAHLLFWLCSIVGSHTQIQRKATVPALKTWRNKHFANTRALVLADKDPQRRLKIAHSLLWLGIWESYPNSTQIHSPRLKDLEKRKNCQHAGSCPQGQRPKALTRGAWRTDSPNHTREARANNTHTI